MFHKFYPQKDFDSVYEIDFQALYEAGFRGLIFDIDNTLVPHGAPATEKVIALFQSLRELGFQTTLLSNNKEPRVSSFQEKVGGYFIFDGKKPAPGNYRKAMDLMGSNLNNTIFIGDQLFTDIYGANKLGLMSYLVHPIHKKEEIQIVLKRYLEKIVLYFYNRRKR